MNHVFIDGIISNDPRLAQTKNGTRVVHFDVELCERSTKDGQDRKTWISVEAWGHLADTLGGAAKGQRVFVEGKLAVSKWTDQNNQARYKNFVRAQNLMLAGPSVHPAPEVEDVPF